MRKSVISNLWISAKIPSRYYVYLYPLNKICLFFFLVQKWVILNCLGLFHICMDTKINKVTKKLNCPCAVTARSRKASFFKWLNFQDSCFTCTVTDSKAIQKKETLSTKWRVPLIALCWLGRNFSCFRPKQRMNSAAAHPEPKLVYACPDSLPYWLHG